MAYDLNGGEKYIMVQPSLVTDTAALVGDADDSYLIGQPVHLVR